MNHKAKYKQIKSLYGHQNPCSRDQNSSYGDTQTILTLPPLSHPFWVEIGHEETDTSQYLFLKNF